jgi:hypothetical protein
LVDWEEAFKGEEEGYVRLRSAEFRPIHTPTKVLLAVVVPISHRRSPRRTRWIPGMVMDYLMERAEPFSSHLWV